MSVHSKEYSRVLSDYNHAASFLRNSLHLNEEISEHEFDEAVMAVASVEMGTERVLGENTLNSRAYRLPSYITDDSRVKLRKQIFDELKSKKRLDDDEKITLGKGGAIPKTPLQKNRQAFYVIGLPASGKSEISSIQEQKKAVRDGYDMDILPSDLATYGGAAKKLLQDLQSRNERYFLLTFLVLNYGDTKRKLENDVFRTAGVAQKHNCTLTRLDFQQERGLVSSLPLGENQIHITRGMTTSAVAIIVPFVTQELFQGGDSLYYGLNAKSGNMIMLDRKNARSPNGLVFGTPGGGKSFSCKREMIGVLLKTHDHVLVCDPEGEYAPLVKLLHGQIIRLSPTSRDYLNPLDINLNYSEDENPLALKSDFVLSLCELIMGGKTGLEAIERTVIDRAVQRIYQPYFADPRPENMPILSDLHAALTAQHLPEADRVAQALDLYVSGSLNFFNNRTTVDIDNRFVCFDIKELPKNLKKPGMLVIQDQVWNRVTRNRNTGVSTWYYADEFHLLLKEPQTAAYSAEIWKRFRKWGGVPTGATQNVKDLLSSPEIENILENSDFICMLNQAAGDRKILAERLNISPEQLKFVTNSPPGEGLLFFENVILPFADKFPRDTELYRIMSTKPSEVNGV